MLEALKEEVLQANLELPKHGLVKFTWGNVSAFDEATGYFVIKPSGVSYEDLKASDMIVCDLGCNIIEGALNPSSDTPTHAVLYQNFKGIAGIVHTHSTWGTAFAQAGEDITAYGTTHADTFYGDIPCARFLTPEEINHAYEAETGNVIVETFKNRGLDFNAVPGILARGHGTFTWGKDANSAVYNSVVLDEVAKMAIFTRLLNPEVGQLPQSVLDKHYNRKHGKDAYYGQK